MELNQLKGEQLLVGTILDWDVFNSEGRLLLRKGYLVQNERQIKRLLDAGLFRIINSSKKTSRSKDRTAGETLFYWGQIISKIHDHITDQNQQAQKEVLMLATDIQRMLELHSNALLAATHLYTDSKHSVKAPIKMAVLSEIITKVMEMDVVDRQLIVAAALTANIGMREIQDDLVSWAFPLNEQQLDTVHNHPQHSVNLLTAAGIHDKIWHRLILEHHEQMDGAGYPKGLKRSELMEGSMVVGLTEIYVGMISNRTYRMGMKAKEALRNLFMCRGRRVDEHTVQVFIKTIGIYPPGSVVRLSNQEVAMVVACRDNGTIPLVKAVSSPTIGPYSKPITRDTKDKKYAIVEMLENTELRGHHWDDLFGPLHRMRNPAPTQRN